MIAEVDTARARLQLSGHVNLQFNVFKTTSTGVRCVCIALFLKRP